MNKRTSQNSTPIPRGNAAPFCRSSGTDFDGGEEVEFEKRCISGTERLIRPHSITYHCKIGAAFPQVRGDHQPVRDGNATSRPRAVYTPPSYRSQDDVEGLIRRN